MNFIHDEVIIELPIDDNLQRRVDEANDIMRRTMEIFTPNVKILTEWALASRWSKEAKPIIDSSGKYQIWSPTTKDESQ